MTFEKWMKEFERKDYPVIMAATAIAVSMLMSFLGFEATATLGVKIFAVCCILLSIRNELKELCELLAGEVDAE